MNNLIKLITLCFATISTAHAEIITFDSPPCPKCGIHLSNYEEQGMLFTGDFTHYGMENSGNAINESLGGVRFAYGDNMRIESTDKSAFNLYSVELAEYSTVFEGKQKTIIFEGVKMDSSTVTQTFSIDGFMNGVNDFELFLFSEDFRNLAYVEINSDIFSMDNLNYSATPVPVPATIVLFISGIAGVFGFSRKKTAA